MTRTYTTEQLAKLSAEWQALKAENPAMRIREAAGRLGVSEAVLLSTTLGEQAIRLEGNWADLLLDCKQLGKVMSLTRNEGCVLEHKGTFQKIDIMGHVPAQIATVIGPIEQRVFFAGWKFGFAVIQNSPRGVMKSLQFFDKAGDAVMKIFLQPKSIEVVFDHIVEKYKAETQEPVLATEAFETPEYSKEVDLDLFRHEWETMKDTHDFFGMLHRHKVHRLEALKLIGEKWAYQVDNLSPRKILDWASSQKQPIMIFAGNKGNIQIHQGKVRTIRVMNNWLNVLDPDFNMHLDENVIDSAWVVHKNTDDGLVSAVELFDKGGETIAQFFGLRKPGIPQNPAWKALLDSLERVEAEHLSI
jgi:putative hemin transport protein